MKNDKNKQLVYDGIEFGLKKDDSSIPASYIVFSREYSQEVGKATSIWTVYEGQAHYGSDLGQVRWFSRWRKYGFFPVEGKVFEETCLREIAFFCETATLFHKAAKKKAV